MLRSPIAESNWKAVVTAGSETGSYRVSRRAATGARRASKLHGGGIVRRMPGHQASVTGGPAATGLVRQFVGPNGRGEAGVCGNGSRCVMVGFHDCVPQWSESSTILPGGPYAGRLAGLRPVGFRQLFRGCHRDD